MNNYVFGSSFSRPFTLTKESRKSVFAHTFSAKSMKGVAKPNDSDGKKISTIVDKNRDNINTLIFLFGTVDLVFSYIYVKLIRKEKFQFKQIAKSFVEFVNGLDVDNKKKIIFAAFPNPASDKGYMKRIINSYKIPNLTQKEIQSYFGFKCREERRKKFNGYLQEYCKLYKINYINVDKELFNKDQSNILEKYIVPDDYNIHLLWEYQLELMTKKLSKFGFKTFNPNGKDTRNYIKKLKREGKLKKDILDELLFNIK